MDGGCVCPGGRTVCSGACVDRQADVSNCGACGQVCGSGMTCKDGKCQCPAGQTACGTACVDSKTDVTNCGGCGQACLTGQTCKDGKCNPVCKGDEILCDGACRKPMGPCGCDAC
jgi:hypothetical protein